MSPCLAPPLKATIQFGNLAPTLSMQKLAKSLTGTLSCEQAKADLKRGGQGTGSYVDSKKFGLKEEGLPAVRPAALHGVSSVIFRASASIPSCAPASYTFGVSGHADTIDSCHAHSASGDNLRDHAVRLLNRGQRRCLD